MATYQRICSTEEVAEGEGRMVVVGDRRLAVIHSGDDFYVIDDACPHAGASLARGIIGQKTVRCRIHHWSFCLKTGRYLDEDRAPCDIASYPVRIVAGQVEAALD
jgi:nitrite reductase/ring-hydroxylating ferredoxin subunit